MPYTRLTLAELRDQAADRFALFLPVQGMTGLAALCVGIPPTPVRSEEGRSWLDFTAVRTLLVRTIAEVLSRVPLRVYMRRQNLQILDTIIETVTVLVVNVFIRTKRAADVLLHYVAMYAALFAINELPGVTTIARSTQAAFGLAKAWQFSGCPVLPVVRAAVTTRVRRPITIETR